MSAAFTLIEVAISAAIVGLIIVALYSGLSSGFAIIHLARENLRANQIMVEKMETIRLYTWEQINTPGYVPTNFTAPFFPAVDTGSTNQSLADSSGLVYSGKITITNAPISASYSNDMRLVKVDLVWTNTGRPRVREMQTLVSRYGMQNYVYTR